MMFGYSITMSPGLKPGRKRVLLREGTVKTFGFGGKHGFTIGRGNITRGMERNSQLPPWANPENHIRIVAKEDIGNIVRGMRLRGKARTLKIEELEQIADSLSPYIGKVTPTADTVRYVHWARHFAFLEKDGNERKLAAGQWASFSNPEAEITLHFGTEGNQKQFTLTLQKIPTEG